MSFTRDVIVYGKMFVRTFLKSPTLQTLSGSIKYYPAWRRYLASRNETAPSTLWISFAATDFLKKIIKTDMQVFEYGSGGSTIFWSSLVKHLVSVEHDNAWFIKMEKQLAEMQIRNVEYFFSNPKYDPDFSKKDFHNPSDYISSDKNFEGKNFEDYVKIIDKYPNSFFDIIVVDGRARPSCIQHSISKLKSGGYLVIDNSERKYYTAPFKFDKQSWKIWKFAGPVPYVHDFSETTILKKNS